MKKTMMGKFIKKMNFFCAITLPFIFLSSCGQEKNCNIRIKDLSNLELSQEGVISKHELKLTIVNKNQTIEIDSVKSILNGNEPLTEWDFGKKEDKTYYLNIPAGVIVGDLLIELNYHNITPTIVYHVFVDTDGVLADVEELHPGQSLQTVLSCVDTTLIVDSIVGVQIGDAPIIDFYFEYDTSTLVIDDATKITGDIHITVNVVRKEYNVLVSTEEGFEGVTILSSATTVPNRADLNTTISIDREYKYNYSIIGVKAYIGESEEPLEDISVIIDTIHLSEAKITIKHSYIVNDINLLVSLQKNESDSYNVVFTDGANSIVSKKKFNNDGFISEPLVVQDNTKFIEKIRVFSTDPEDEKKVTELVENKDFLYNYDDCILTISPYAPKGNIKVKVLLCANDGLTFENETWELLAYYANCGWEQFTNIYKVPNNDYVGKLRSLTLKDNQQYNVRVVDQNEGQETNKELLLFEFDRVFHDWNKPFRDDYEAVGRWEGSNLQAALEHGSFFSVVPDWLNNIVRTISRAFVADKTGSSDYYEDIRFFVLDSDNIDGNTACDVSGGQYGLVGASHILDYYRDISEEELVKRRAKDAEYWIPSMTEKWNNLVGYVKKDGRTACKSCGESDIKSHLLPCFYI